jgi:glycosyltransferase involved in cell wall biosynthesis
MSTSLSVLYLSFNEEDIIEKSLDSIHSIADEIIVVDSGSSDSTPDIARNAGAIVFHRELKNWGEQRNWGLIQCQHPWILVIDCDEILSPELIASLTDWKNSKTQGHMPYSFKRVHFFQGRKMKYSGLQNDFVVRLLPKEVRFKELNVHEKVLSKSTGLTGDLFHHTYKNPQHWEQKIKGYAVRQAKDYKSQVSKVGWFHLKVKPSWRFFKHFIIKGGIFDGQQGFSYSLWMYRAVKWRYVEVKKLRLK